jgi:hypothetical protein
MRLAAETPWASSSIVDTTLVISYCENRSRGKIFRIVDRDEPSGYVVRNVETTGEGTTLCYLQSSSS